MSTADDPVRRAERGATPPTLPLPVAREMVIPVRRAERGATPPTLPLPVAREMVMERFEREHPTAELGQHGGNISRAATPPDTLSP